MCRYIMNKINTNIPHEMFLTKNQHRADIDLLRRRICLLDGKDKLIMSMYLDNGNSFRQISRLLGVCEATISRKIHRLTRHLTGQQFQIYRKNLEKFNERQKDIARDYFLMGLSMRQIASKRQCSYYRTQKTRAQIQHLIKKNDS